MGTGPSQRAVSNLDFELRKVREFQNSSRGVMAKAITPPSLQTVFPRQPEASFCDGLFYYEILVFII